MRILAVCVLVGLLVAGAVDVARYYPQLPQKVASHFDAAGRPNGWSSKPSFVTLYLGVTLAIAVAFLILPWLLPRLPARMVNLPHKDYWLAPDRRAQTCRWLSAWLLWMGSATLAFLVALFHLTVRANLGPRPALGASPLWLLVGFGGFTLVWCVWVFTRFRRPRGG